MVLDCIRLRKEDNTDLDPEIEMLLQQIELDPAMLLASWVYKPVIEYNFTRGNTVSELRLGMSRMQ